METRERFLLLPGLLIVEPKLIMDGADMRIRLSCFVLPSDLSGMTNANIRQRFLSSVGLLGNID